MDAVQSSAPPLGPGAVLDRYELLCPLAQGGMAAVWVARLRGKHGFEKLVALKMIRSEYASDSHFRQMFLDEAHIAAGIEHPNAAQILDLGEHRGALYIAMELVDGESLARLMRNVDSKKALIPIGIACRVIADTCAGVHAAHELRDRRGKLLQVVHRDVSPQNIMITTKGVAKIIDFGVAKARDRLSEETNAGTLKGKVSYMAPEQIDGIECDRRADVWALGAVLHHLLAGTSPFDGGNPAATLKKVLAEEPPSPLPSRVPEAVADVVNRALVYDPEQRLPTALALRIELESAMVEAGLSATTEDVAAYCAAQMLEVEAARRAHIEAALAAAIERGQGRTPSVHPPSSHALEASIANMSSTERVALALRIASGNSKSPDGPRDKESVAQMLMALGGKLPEVDVSTGIDEMRPSDISGGASVGRTLAPDPRAKSKRGSSIFVLVLAAALVGGIVAVAIRWPGRVSSATAGTGGSAASTTAIASATARDVELAASSASATATGSSLAIVPAGVPAGSIAGAASQKTGFGGVLGKRPKTAASGGTGGDQTPIDDGF